jgi:hypothetical protein
MVLTVGTVAAQPAVGKDSHFFYPPVIKFEFDTQSSIATFHLSFIEHCAHSLLVIDNNVHQVVWS